jgi:hypothetical protein
MSVDSISLASLLSLTQLVYNIIQNARKAYGAYHKLTREVEAFNIVLDRLRAEVSKPDSILNQKGDNRRKELSKLVRDCKKVLGVFSRILEKYKSLSERNKKRTTLWQRIRFGNDEMQDLGKIREELGTYTQLLTMHLNMLAIGSQGKVEAYMDKQSKETRDMKRALNFIIAKLQAREKLSEKSSSTDPASDDKLVWKEFRRELLKEGFSSWLLVRHKKTIKKYILELDERGLWDISTSENTGSREEGEYHDPVTDTDVVLDGPNTPHVPVIDQKEPFSSRVKVNTNQPTGKRRRGRVKHC